MIKLSDITTKAPKELKKEDIKRKTDRMARRIGDLQHILSAEKKHSLLIVLQGMDASGKDGVTRKIFTYCTPTSINAYAFRKPTDVEFAHDFLWRIHRQAPAKGNIKIFIRSHYEDILIQRVHGWIDDEKRAARMHAINEWETNLQKDNNTTILKFYMHLSFKKQEEKLQERIDDPRKQFKHNPDDWKEREFWPQYMEAYEYAINESKIPWIIAPVDQRWYRDYFIAEKVLDTLESLNMKLPTLAEHAKSAD